LNEESRINVAGLSPGDVALLKSVADAAAESAVKRMFVSMGLDPEDPINAQANFNFLRNLNERNDDPEAQADAIWVRKARLRSEGMIGKAVSVAVGAAVLNLIYLVGKGVASLLPPLPPPH